MDLTVEEGAIVLRRPRKSVRVGWADASKRLAKRGEHRTVWPDFPNRDDAKLKW